MRNHSENARLRLLRYLTIPVTPFQQNCSILWCDETRDAAVVDPGGDLPKIRAETARLGVTLKPIQLTHGHIDHADGDSVQVGHSALSLTVDRPELALSLG